MRLCFCVALLLFINIIGAVGDISAQNSKHSIKEEMEACIDEAESCPYSDPQKAIALANKVIAYAHKNNDNRLLSRAELINGHAYVNYGDFATGFEYVKNALNVCPEDDKYLYSKIVLRMSSLYIYLRDLNRAFEYANKALSIAQELRDSAMLAACYNTIGLVNIHVPDNELAEQNFYKALEINRKIENKRGLVRNLNNLSLYKCNNSAKKIEMLYEAIAFNKQTNESWSLAENYNNLGMQYYFIGDYKRAIESLKEAREYAKLINAKELLLDNDRYFANVYRANGNFKEAYQHLNTVLNEIEREKMAEQIRIYETTLLQKSLDTTNKSIKEREQEYQIIKMRYMLLIILLLFSVIIMVAAYFAYRFRQQKRMQILEAKTELEARKNEIISRENELVNLQLEQKKREASNAAKELENIREQLTNTAFFVRSRGEMLSNIQTQIRETYKLSEEEKLSKLHAISRNISQFNSKNNEMELLVDKVSSDFIFQLSHKYPHLTENEKRLASLLRIGLSSKEIASIIASQPKTVDMARYRLRKKMELDSDEGLQECLSKI